MSKFSIVIAGDVNEGSPNKRLHHRVRHELDQRWQLMAFTEWMSIGCPVLTKKVCVSFVVYRGKAIDHCNIHGSRCLKALIDGLKGRAYVDDDPKHLEWGTVRLVVSKAYRDDPTVFMVVEEISPVDGG